MMLRDASVIRKNISKKLNCYILNSKEQAHLTNIQLAIDKAAEDFNCLIEYEIPIEEHYMPIVLMLREKGYQVKTCNSFTKVFGGHGGPRNKLTHHTLYISWE